MSEKIIQKCDSRGNLIYYRGYYRGYGEQYEIWREYDDKNRVIYHKGSFGWIVYYRYNEEGKAVVITKKEFEQIKRGKEQKEFLSREEVSRFELMDL